MNRTEQTETITVSEAQSGDVMVTPDGNREILAACRPEWEDNMRSRGRAV